jgi:hypothetical protein
MLRWTVALLIAVTEPSYVHDAPSGWHYPEHCCAKQHCHRVACESINEQGGGYTWRNLFFTKPQTSLSGDGECHVCHDWGDERGWLVPVNPECLFLNHGS